LINEAACAVLRPLGLSQRGRIWLDDNGWWLGVVEFQPSSWSRGSYLNVGPMWLWQESWQNREIHFDIPWRDQALKLVEYESDEQFAPLAYKLALHAAERIEYLRAQFPDVNAASKRITSDDGWSVFNRGVALGLAGKRRRAIRELHSLREIGDKRDWWLRAVGRADEYAEMLNRADGVATLRLLLLDAIRETRSELKLDPDSTPLVLA
jgi:hypothetical protein